MSQARALIIGVLVVFGFVFYQYSAGLTDKSRSQQSALSGLLVQSHDLTGKMASMIEESETLKSSLETLRTENAQLRESLNAAKKSAEDNVATSASGTVDLQRKISELETALDVSKTENADLLKKVKSSRKSISEKDALIASQQTEITDLKSKVVEAIVPPTGVETDCSQKDMQITSLSSKMMGLQKEISDLKASTKQVATGDPPASCKDFKPKFLRFREPACPWIAHRYELWTEMPPICDFLNMECVGVTPDERPASATSLFGYPWVDFMMSHADIMFLEFVFTKHEYYRHVVELGTSAGITTLYMGIISGIRYGELHTWDINDRRNSHAARLWPSSMHFHEESVLDGENPNVVKALQQSEPIIALFDNGDKRKEVHLYCKYIPLNSILMVHDWQTTKFSPNHEIGYSMISAVLEKHGYEKRYFDFAEHLSSGIRAFQRVRMSE